MCEWICRPCAFLRRPPKRAAFPRRLELLLSSRSLPYGDRLTVLNSLGAMIANICAGIGCGYLPRSIVESYIEKGLMVEYPLDNPFSKLDVVFIYRKDHVQDAAFRYFLEQIKPQ
jgi:DNA-binding transcriptional LysR family regulator